MIRAVGLTDLLSALPGVVVVLFALLTQLGDFWLTLSLSALVYWLGPYTPRLGRGLTRDHGAMVLALLASAVALTVTLKAVFGLPRPVGAGVPPHAELVPAAFRDIYTSMATGDGYGFPSGHATTSLLVWGGLAWAVRAGTRRQRVAVAGGVTLLVGLSRLVLGVHYLVDILAGFAVAGTALWLAVTRLRTPDRVFGLAAVVAVGGLLVAGLTVETGGAVAMAAVGAVTWRLLGDRLPTGTRRGATLTTVLGLGTVVLGVAVVVLTDPAPLVAGLGAGVGTTLVLAMPLVGEHVGKK